MNNLYGIATVLVVLLILGTGTWISWDQIALSMGWPRPGWGAGVGVVFIAAVVNLFVSNRLVVGKREDA